MSTWSNQNKSSAATWSVTSKNASSLTYFIKGYGNPTVYDKDTPYDKDRSYDGVLINNWSYQNKN